MKFLVLQHAPHESPGRYAELAIKMGVQLETVELWKGEMLPGRAAYGKYDAAIIMGGPQGINDSKKDYPNRDGEIDFIRRFDKPVLGHCLGSQLIAYALGGNVYRDDRKECGFYPVRKSSARSIFDGFDERFQVFHWHGDSFDVPEGSAPLVYSQDNAVQAFSYDNKFGVLFHVEMTYEMIRELLRIDQAWFENEDRRVNHGNNAQSIMQKAAELESQMQRQAERLFSNFVSVC
ncbi:MAG: GMP synthase family protein [archaeon GW2011_AR5]|nr:MAG: GMP synthase family protein [archaeon GW2011_AR5]